MEIDAQWQQMAALTNNQRKEKLSIAWLSAMASIAGFASSVPVPDTDSIDMTLSANGPLSPKLDVQMKATASPRVSQSGLHFVLQKKNHNDLCADRAIPLILVIVELPKSESEWIDFTTDDVVLRRRAWWTSLKGEEVISNQSKTIIVPKSQLFDVNVLIDLMVKARAGAL